MPGQPFGRIRLGRRLRELRERAEVSRVEAAQAIRRDTPDLIRFFENGDRLIDLLQLETLARFYGCSDQEIAELEELHGLAATPGAFSSFGLPEKMITYLDLERFAVRIRTFQNLIIPGMLQTEPYMRRLFEQGRVDSRVVAQRVRARLTRQERLAPTTGAPHPVHLSAVIAEEALLRCARQAGGASDQFDHLIRVARQENVEVRVMALEVGIHSGMDGSFTCLTFNKGVVGDFAYLETAAGGQLTDQESTVRKLDTVFDELRSQALDPTKSLTLIAQFANRVGGGTQQ